LMKGIIAVFKLCSVSNPRIVDFGKQLIVVFKDKSFDIKKLLKSRNIL
jgi:hypothetical protein